ncbi:DUF3054 family protein [Phytoactinopolyspora sp. XMNu-373]|uniref:DUF3054 family protein n=2 Tax=Phytoactinopolyspora mesophila TaxID=2650750 RepID=A0A7K3M2K6_9ACTN|nr:DUF3054 domain-containing protein [Phytoactinopolyspora mesophila]NDL57152.1 DUF3054 family protein [Phytoactinopolyspora mesophila]
MRAAKTWPASGRSIWTAALVDLVIALGFVLAGRGTHDGPALVGDPQGFAESAWPFVVAAAVGWLVTRAWRWPLSPVRAGVGIWAATVVVGMSLRAVSGQGTALPFVIVAPLTLAALLIGWRVVARRFLAARPPDP